MVDPVRRGRFDSVTENSRLRVKLTVAHPILGDNWLRLLFSVKLKKQIPSIGETVILSQIRDVPVDTTVSLKEDPYPIGIFFLSLFLIIYSHIFVYILYT